MSTKSDSCKVFVPCLLSALLVGAPPAMAVDNPFHVEANIGRAAVDDIGGVSIDESSTYARLGTGYRFLPWLGISGSYVDLGTVESKIAAGPGVTIPVKASADGFELLMTGHMAISDALSLRADAGMFRWKSDSRVGGVSTRDNGNDPTWGVGVEYALSSRVTVAGGWRRYTVDDVDANTTWLGLKVIFGDTQ